MKIKKITLICAIIVFSMSISACGNNSTTNDDKADTEEAVEQEEKEEVSSTAVFEETQAEILDADFCSLDDGDRAIRVSFKYTNNSSDGMYMLESFVVKAFQNGVELDDATDINEESDIGNSAELIREAKDGASIEGSYVFVLNDDSDVEVRVCTPTSDEELLASKTYTVAG